MPVGTRLDEVDNYISYRIKHSNSRAIVQPLRSFSDLLMPNNADFDSLAEGLALSYVEQAEKSISEEAKNNLERYLKLIFNNSVNLKLTLKAYDLIGNDFLYSDSRIVTDIRLVFNDDIQNNPRNALIVHHLTVEYFLDGQKKIIMALDLSDFKKA